MALYARNALRNLAVSIFQTDFAINLSYFIKHKQIQDEFDVFSLGATRERLRMRFIQ